MSTKTHSKSNRNIRTDFYTIKLSGNNKYLLFKFKGSNDSFNIIHSGVSFETELISLIIFFVAFIALCLIIERWRKRIKKDLPPKIYTLPLLPINPEDQPQSQPLYTQTGYPWFFLDR